VSKLDNHNLATGGGSIKKIIFVFVVFVMLSGCSQSAKIAQDNLARSSTVQSEIDMALFEKAWGMNRIAFGEASLKDKEHARGDLLQAQLDGNLTVVKAQEIVDNMHKSIASHEPPMSRGFAYLTFLMIQAEKVKSLDGTVDVFIESKKPIWQHIFKQARATVQDAVSEVERWVPLIGEVQSLVNKFKVEAAKAAVAQ